MNVITETKKGIAVLLETNRALSADLDASRRLAAALGRERDALQRELSGSGSAPAVAAEGLQSTLAAQRQELEELRHERDELLREVDEQSQQLTRAEEQLTVLTVAVRRLERERDEARVELDAAGAAMGKIRECLRQSLQDACGFDEPEAWR